MTVYRNTANNVPFLWESDAQPEARWHAKGQGPVQYFADTPEGAWAEFIRHAEISEPEELLEVARILWAVEIPDNLNLAKPRLDSNTLLGSEDSYPSCQAEAQRIKASRNGYAGLESPSAALTEAYAYQTNSGVRKMAHQPKVIVLFGAQPQLRAFKICIGGIPPEVLSRVRPIR